jgi:hypothetical protein
LKYICAGILFGKVVVLDAHKYAHIETALRTTLQVLRKNLLLQISFSLATNIEIANKKSS